MKANNWEIRQGTPERSRLLCAHMTRTAAITHAGEWILHNEVDAAMQIVSNVIYLQFEAF